MPVSKKHLQIFSKDLNFEMVCFTMLYSLLYEFMRWVSSIHILEEKNGISFHIFEEKNGNSYGRKAQYIEKKLKLGTFLTISKNFGSIVIIDSFWDNPLGNWAGKKIRDGNL